MSRNRRHVARRLGVAALLGAFAVAAATFGGAAEQAGASSAPAKRAQPRGLSAPAAKLARQTRRTRSAKREFRARPAWRRAARPQSRRQPRTLAASPRASADAYRGRVGAASGMVWNQQAQQLSQLVRAHAVGLRWIREDFHWGAFEPKPGVWDWTLGDRLMRNAAMVGVNVLPVVAYSAGWAASGPTIYHPPRDPKAYGAFCRRIVERYGPSGTFWRDHPQLSPRPITALEIWNEPWHEDFWRPAPSAVAYAALLRAAGTAIHGAHPEVKVLASADIFQYRTKIAQPRDWFAELIVADPGVLRSSVDAYSVHLYVQGRSPLDSVTPQRWRFDRLLLTRSLAASVGAAHPIWITEFGWTTHSGHPDSVSEATQARYMTEALRRVAEWGSFVERSFVFFWGTAKSDRVGGHGLLRADGSPKPVVHELTRLLGGSA